MAQPHLTRELARTEEAVTPSCSASSTTPTGSSTPKGQLYESLKQLSDSEVLTLAIFQQLRGVESERSFLRDVGGRFFAHLFPGVVGLLEPSSLQRRLRKLRRFLEPLRHAAVVPELVVGDPETLIVDSTLLSVLHPAPGRPVGGLRGRRVGPMGILQRLWGEAAPSVRHKWCACLLRADARERRRGVLGGGVAR